MTESAPHLSIEGLVYRVKEHVLIDGISLVSEPDLCSALVGPNGAGKTILLKLCHGLLTPASGKVLWADQTPEAMGRKITMVFQKPCVLRRSVYANLDYVLKLRRLGRPERRRRVDEALQLVGMETLAARKAPLLSGGEKKRLAIACAWVLNPQVILFDEPTSELDLHAAAMVEKTIMNLRKRGIKIVFSSHNLAQVRRLCDEVIFLNRGRCITHTGKDDFFNKPQDPTICEFMRSQVFV